MFTSPSVQNPSVQTIRMPQVATMPERHIRCDVIFGSPSADCRATGICKIIASSGDQLLQKRDCQRTAACLSYHDDSNVLSIHLFRELLCVNVWKSHLRDGVLVMKEPCLLPPEISEYFELPTCVLPTGNHVLRDEGDHYTLQFQLSGKVKTDNYSQ